MQFSLADAATNGNYIGSPFTNPSVPVSNGLFTATLTFDSSVFDGSARWLEIGVRTNGSVEPYAILTPRQAVTAAPYATFAATSGTAVLASNLSAGAVLIGNGLGITNLSGANITAASITSNQLDAAT